MMTRLLYITTFKRAENVRAPLRRRATPEFYRLAHQLQYLYPYNFKVRFSTRR